MFSSPAGRKFFVGIDQGGSYLLTLRSITRLAQHKESGTRLLIWSRPATSPQEGSEILGRGEHKESANTPSALQQYAWPRLGHVVHQHPRLSRKRSAPLRG